MKKIEALVRPERLSTIKKSLAEMGHRSLIHHDIWYRGTENEINHFDGDGNSRLYDFMAKVKIELIVRDEEAETVINTICDNAITGHKGDGKIFVLPVETAIRIQTRETGDTVI